MKTFRCPLFSFIRPSLLALRRGTAHLLLGAALALTLGVTSARAASSPPEFMTYQGFLVDANGSPLATNAPANYPVIFRIFSAASGGQRYWSEQQIVTVDKGTFSVILGEGTIVSGETKPPLSSVFTGASASDRYIGISVTIGAANLEILPRLRLLPAPYAFLATSAANVVTPAGSNVISYANNRVEIDGQIRASSSAFPSLTLDSSSIVGTWMALGNSSAGGRYWQMIASGSANGGGAGNLIFATGTAPGSTTGSPLVLQPNGNVGLGTLTPNAQLSFGPSLANTKLAVWDGGPDAAFGFGIQPSQFRFHVNGAADRFSFLNGPAGTELMTVQGGGNVGIGTTAPSGKLDVLGGIRARGGAPGPFGNANNGYSFTTGGDNDSGMFSTGDGQVEFYSNNSERMRVHGNGNIGIITANPLERLQIGDTNVAGDHYLAIKSSGGNAYRTGIKFRHFNDTGGFNIEDDERGGVNGLNFVRYPYGAGVSSMFLDRFNGFVGLGTTVPSDRLHLRGGILRIDDGGIRYIQMYRSVNGFIIAGNSMSQQGGGNGAIQWDGDGNWDSLSDRRLKTDITDAEPVLARVMQLPVRRYRWKESAEEAPKKFGVIAQEVKLLFPESVGFMTRPGDTEESMTVKYASFGLIAVKALQEFKVEKDAEQAALKREVADLKQEISLLKSRLTKTAQIEQEMDGLKEMVMRLAGRIEPGADLLQGDDSLRATAGASRSISALPTTEVAR